MMLVKVLKVVMLTIIIALEGIRGLEEIKVAEHLKNLQLRQI